MSTLHLSVLNDGSVYPELCRIARKHHSGEYTYSAAFSYFRGVVSRVARNEINYTPADITAATHDVMDYHVRHVCENAPAYKWKVTRGDDERDIFFMTEAEAFAYILRSQGQSVHYATHVENWTLEPVTT